MLSARSHCSGSFGLPLSLLVPAPEIRSASHTRESFLLSLCVTACGPLKRQHAASWNEPSFHGD